MGKRLISCAKVLLIFVVIGVCFISNPFILEGKNKNKPIELPIDQLFYEETEFPLKTPNDLLLNLDLFQNMPYQVSQAFSNGHLITSAEIGQQIIKWGYKKKYWKLARFYLRKPALHGVKEAQLYLAIFYIKDCLRKNDANKLIKAYAWVKLYEDSGLTAPSGCKPKSLVGLLEQSTRTDALNVANELYRKLKGKIKPYNYAGIASLTKDIQACYGKFRDACLNDKTDIALKMLDSNSYETANILRYHLLYSGKEKLKKLGPLDTALILSLRVNINKEKLLSMSPKEIMISIIKRFSKRALTGSKIQYVVKKKNGCIGQVLIRKVLPGDTIKFKKEKGSWKLNLFSTKLTVALQSKFLPKTNYDAFIPFFQFLTGKKVTKDVWLPLAKLPNGTSYEFREKRKSINKSTLLPSIVTLDTNMLEPKDLRDRNLLNKQRCEKEQAP